MQSSLKKSLYLGLAALSFVSVAAVSTTASAKSAAKVTSDKVMTSDATKRNINLTGKNAIYTKPGTTKGAKVIATTTTAKNLKNSKSSHKNFRAYRVAKTNRGSIYYKVVSYDKAYRGWVYGGKSASEFAGGTAAYTTFKEGTLTADQKNGNFKITNPGKTTDGLTYKQPAWTQYKIGKTMADTTAYKNATFSVDKIGTRTREGDTWVHVVNQNTADTKADGWILLSNLTQTNAFNEATQIKVVINDNNGKQIASFNHTVANATAKGTDATADVYSGYTAPAAGANPDFTGVTAFGASLQAQVNSALKGTGYTAVATDKVNQTTIATGATLTLVAKKGAQATTPVKAYAYDNQVAGSTPIIVATKDTAAADKTAYLTTNSLPSLATAFTGTNGEAFSSNDVVNYLTANKATTFKSVDFYLPASTPANASQEVLASATLDETDTNTDLYHVNYTLNGALGGSYGDASASAYYTGTLVAGTGASNGNGSTTNPGDWNN
ncbi:S-layer protein [Levilactobacillus tujiorum]|uniref:S-layer protein n=1 Tax=Levilactobacillus tujiorum TaxID=2912243 RepID=UPI001B3B2208|nr:S-layer protein [Levilactobacillus tujiorum]MCH5464077.1 S-layer protein [Levilactobacillus tujiorum]